MFLLDTDHLGIIQRQTEPEFSRLVERMRQHSLDEFSTCIISFHEQVLGWNSYLSKARTSADVVRTYRRFERILADFSTMNLLPFDDAAAAVFDSLRARKIRVATMDLRIAAIAIARDAVLLSRNLKDFAKIPSLRVEDWTAP